MARAILIGPGAAAPGAGPGPGDPRDALAAWAPGLSGRVALGPATLAAAALLAFLVGRLDDRGLLGPARKWTLQAGVLAGGAAGLFLLAERFCWIPPASTGIEPRASAWGAPLWPLALAFGAGLMLQVALEILDHLDGLLAVNAAAAAAALALAGPAGWPREAGLAACGASLGFLCWNRPPARFYLGNGGSLAVATVLPLLLFAAALSGIGLEIPDAGGFTAPAGQPLSRSSGPDGLSPWRFAAVLPAFAWPLADFLFVTGARLKRGDPPWRGGRDHLAHRLARRLRSDAASFAIVAVVAVCGFFLAATALR